MGYLHLLNDALPDMLDRVQTAARNTWGDIGSCGTDQAIGGVVRARVNPD